MRVQPLLQECMTGRFPPTLIYLRFAQAVCLESLGCPVVPGHASKGPLPAFFSILDGAG